VNINFGGLFSSDRTRIKKELDHPGFQYRILTEEDVARSGEALAESKVQIERADLYTANLRNAALNGAKAQALFIERFGPLRAEITGIAETAYVQAQTREQEILGELDRLKDRMRSVRRSIRGGQR
jgi:hypothetical protein